MRRWSQCLYLQQFVSRVSNLNLQSPILFNDFRLSENHLLPELIRPKQVVPLANRQKENSKSLRYLSRNIAKIRSHYRSRLRFLAAFLIQSVRICQLQHSPDRNVTGCAENWASLWECLLAILWKSIWDWCVVTGLHGPWNWDWFGLLLGLNCYLKRVWKRIPVSLRVNPTSTWNWDSTTLKPG